jgi:hypothetical protein
MASATEKIMLEMSPDWRLAPLTESEMAPAPGWPSCAAGTSRPIGAE